MIRFIQVALWRTTRNASIRFLQILLIATVCSRASTIFYVDATSHGANTGLSWNDAFNDLQDALTACADGDSIWIRAGVYRPTSGDDSRVSFHLTKAVALYGGFAGFESRLEQRDWRTNQTVISGDIGAPDDPTDNSLSVVVLEPPSQCRLDGLIIRDGGNPFSGEGGGVFQPSGFPLLVDADHGNVLANCTFTNNNAHFSGGAVSVVHGSMLITNCDFLQNTSASYGGALSLGGAEAIRIESSRFIGNSDAYSGGAIYDGLDVMIENSVFMSNHADADGGAVAWPQIHSNGLLVNCLFADNSATYNGGAALLTNTSIINCTFVNNVALLGSGAAVSGGFSAVNSIFWANTAADGRQFSDPESAIVSFSDVQAGFPGYANLTVDPLFAAAQSGDFRLSPSSPLINAGTNQVIAVLEDTDLAGNPRIDKTADLGAYEYIESIRVAVVSVEADGPVTVRVLAPLGSSYEIERGEILGEWAPVGVATARNTYYEFTDRTPPLRGAYYRAKQL